VLRGETVLQSFSCLSDRRLYNKTGQQGRSGTGPKAALIRTQIVSAEDPQPCRGAIFPDGGALPEAPVMIRPCSSDKG
jgi:hypothetical protein